MRLIRTLAIALLAAAPFCAKASAQQLDITGAWSWQTNTPQESSTSTLFLRPDGGFVLTARLANGTMLRRWGQYDVMQIGPDAVRLQTRIAGYLPHTSCIAIAGFGQRCQPAPPAPAFTVVLAVTSPTTLQMEGLILQRDFSGGLINAAVPDTAVIAGVAPTQPIIAQPVMPHLTPYQTPNGPGNQMANQFHHSNENFSQGYMRGCVKDIYGRWVGCEQ